MTSIRILAVLLLAAGMSFAAPRFEVSFSADAREEPVDGRIIVVVSKNLEREPRTQVGWSFSTQQIFGVDAVALEPGEKVTVTEDAIGHPLVSLRDLEPGTYNVQAVLNVYETFHRADGHEVLLPMDNGEGQQWNRSPGNLFSSPREIAIAGDSVVSIDMDNVIPPIEPPEDTKYIRHVRIQSDLLTKFWGRPMFLSAIVLVPEGFDENPQQHYPILFNQGHFPSGYRSFRRFETEWTSGELPKMLIVLTQHPTPYYDDSYGVNSANMGPYGDALTEELYPYIEQQFRAIGESWARVVFGGSTGGWMSLAQQVFYPDYFGGAWGFCPDPVDFHAFQLINVYSDENAYFASGPFKRIPRPLARQPNGQPSALMEEFSRQESVLGEHDRSGGQLAAFKAVFGPVGPDGYPAPLWDPVTGEIDPQVAAYWRENYDLTAILTRDWEWLGPKLEGKLHVTMGTKDTYYLDGAVHLLEQFLESEGYDDAVEYGDNQPHCWTGDIGNSSLESYYLPVFADHMRNVAPEGADVESWSAGIAEP